MMRWPLPVRRTDLSLAALLLAAGPALAERFECVVQPSRSVTVGSPVSGVLAEVAVGRGDRVAEGDRLARVEDRVERAAVAVQAARTEDRTRLAAQQARLRFAEARMTRAEELFARGTASQETLDEASAELAVNRAEIDRLETELRLAALELERFRATLALRTILSPLDGVVTERALDRGEYVGQEDWIVEIADLDPLHVEAFLPIAYFDQIAPGMTAEVRLRQPADMVAQAGITVIDRVFDARSGTFRIRLHLPNPDWSLPAGQRCTLDLAVEPVNDAGSGLALPGLR